MMKMIRSAAVGRANFWPASVLGWAAFIALHPLACVTKDVDPLAEQTGNGGSGVAAANGGSSGASGSTGTSTGGSAGGTTNDPLSFVMPCLPTEQALLSDFTYTVASAADAGADGGAADAGPIPDPTAVNIGDFYSTLSGGTFRYPGATDAYPVASDVTMGNWHLSGSIGTYSGFGLYLTGCNQLDASRYEGISFSIVGNVAMGDVLSFYVGTAADDISYLWSNAQTPPPNPPAAPNPGRCLPAMNQYDGTCVTPSFQVPVTATKTTIEVRWEDLTGGRPSAVNPAEITDIRWIFPVPPGAGTNTPVTYDADIYIDDLRFIVGP